MDKDNPEDTHEEDYGQGLQNDIYGGILRARTLLTKVINRWTTYPVPTTETWKAATAADDDLSKILTALQNGNRLLQADLQEKSYYHEWAKGRLEAENGILFQLEAPRLSKIRQLRRKIVPKTLRNTIISAYHAIPLAGHMGVYKTYWRIAARYWWPSMYSKVRAAVLACGHCKVANATNHEACQKIGALAIPDAPFDVIAMDIWSPGKTKDQQIKSDRSQKAVLDAVCTLTGFAAIAFLSEVNSETVARLAFSQFFVPHGLPKLVMIDAGSEFKDTLIRFLDALGVHL
jgi:hypothetical protein